MKKVITMFGSKKCFITLLFLMSYIVLASPPANAYERQEFMDGLAEKWHPGSFCIPCHYTVAGTEKAKKISTGCQCHNYKQKNNPGMKIDMTRILDIHTDMVCIKCHMGSEKNLENTNASDIHRIMNRVACLKCHSVENGTMLKPKDKKCSFCHGADPHIVHGKKLESICVACHAEFGEKYVNKSVDQTEKMSSPSSIVKMENSIKVESRNPSIGEIVSKLFSSMMNLIW